MTPAAFPHASTHTAPISAAFIHVIEPAEVTTDAFYREAARSLQHLVLELNSAAPFNVTSDPAWQHVVDIVDAARVRDASRASIMLALTCAFDSARVIDAIDHAIRERAA